MKFIYQLSAGGSFLHRLDPRTKLLFLLVYLFMVWSLPWPAPLVMAIGIILIMWLVGKTSPGAYYPFLLFLLPIMVAIILVQSLVGPAPKITYIIPISASGLQLGLFLAFRLAAMGIAFIIFSMTTDPFDWGISMYNMGLPFKGAFMFAFAMRFFPLLQEEEATIYDALRARGHRGVDTKNPFALVEGSAISIFPLGLGALRRSQSIALSMELRGFDVPEKTKIKRTVFRDVRIRKNDIIIMIVTLMILVTNIIYLIFR